MEDAVDNSGASKTYTAAQLVSCLKAHFRTILFDSTDLRMKVLTTRLLDTSQNYSHTADLD